MSRTRIRVALAAGASAIFALGAPARGASPGAIGDAAAGAVAFQACATCHATAAGEELTGPSLAHVWRRKAGTAAGFDRYSDAMVHSDFVWDEQTLDRWLSDPRSLIPGTTMTFPGLRDRKTREDVIAYLRAVSEGVAPLPPRGAMATSMQSTRLDLKRAPPASQVVEIGHCKDAYTVTTADGKTRKIWEFNLRFKTDSSKSGPRNGRPVIVGAGMQGDRSSVVFATPAEISTFVRDSCP